MQRCSARLWISRCAAAASVGHGSAAGLCANRYASSNANQTNSSTTARQGLKARAGSTDTRQRSLGGKVQVAVPGAARELSTAELATVLNQFESAASTSTTTSHLITALAKIIKNHRWRARIAGEFDLTVTATANVYESMVRGRLAKTLTAEERNKLLSEMNYHFLAPERDSVPPLVHCAEVLGAAYAGETPVLATGESKTKLISRYVAPPKDLRAAVASSRPQVVTDRVVVISGSSGSGKTDLAITAKIGPTDGDHLVVVYLRHTDIRDAFDVISLPTADPGNHTRNLRGETAVTKVVQDVLDECTDGDSSWNTGNDAVHLRVVLDELGNSPLLVRAVIAMQLEIRKKLKDTYGLHSASLVVVGTGLDDPEAPCGSEHKNYTVLRLDDNAETFNKALRECLPQCFADVMKDHPGVLSGATVQAMLGNPRLGSLMVRNLSRHSDLNDVCTLENVPKELPMHLATPSRLRKVLDLCVSGAIGHFRSLNGMQELPPAEIRAVLRHALAIDAGAYDEIADAHEDLRVKYGCLLDRAAYHPLSNADQKFVVGSLFKPTQSATTYRVLKAEPEQLLLVPLDSFGRYRIPDAYRAMFLTLAGADDIVDNLSTAGDFERIAWVWAGTLPLLATRTVQHLLSLQCTAGTVASLDPWKEYRPAEPYRGRHLQRSGLHCDAYSPSKSVPDGAGVYLQHSRRMFPFHSKAFESLSAAHAGIGTLPSVIKNTSRGSPSNGESPWWLPFHDAKWRKTPVCVLNAGRAPAEDVHLRVPSTAERESETVLLQVKRYWTKCLSNGIILEELAKSGVQPSTTIEPQFEAARGLRKHDDTARLSFVFVAALGPAAKRTGSWPTIKQTNVCTSKEQATGQSKETTVFVHECKLDAAGRIQRKNDGSREFMYPLFVAGIDPDDCATLSDGAADSKEGVEVADDRSEVI